ncbi:MAG: PASTA domain-containing protein [Salibacteraceae bacterium]
MKHLFRFLISRTFFLNLVLAALVVAGGLWFTLNRLEIITLHGESISVPDFTGFKLDELDDFVLDQDVRYEVVDSVFDLKRPLGTVLSQVPPAGFEVKPGRKIYLTVNSFRAPTRELPTVKDRGFKDAVYELESRGFRINEIIYEPSPSRDVALRVEQKGSELEPGTVLDIGTKVDLIVGAGIDRTKPVYPPSLYGFTLEESKTMLETLGLNVGTVVFEDCQTETDSNRAVVFFQEPVPSRKTILYAGDAVEITLSTDRSRVPIRQMEITDTIKATIPSLPTSRGSSK